MNITRLSNRSVEFDVVGVDASIANALRRILIAEVRSLPFYQSMYVLIVGAQVPAIAIEYVYIWNNTSSIVDEVLSHRLGLIPLNVDPARIEMKDSASSAHSLFIRCSSQKRMCRPDRASD